MDNISFFLRKKPVLIAPIERVKLHYSDITQKTLLLVLS